MEISEEILDLTANAYDENRILPAALLRRGPGECWVTLNSPLGEQAWVSTAAGDFVRVPLYPYLITSTEPAVAMLYGMELGVKMLEATAHLRPKRLHIVVGSPINEVARPGGQSQLRFWLGFAARTEDKT